MDPKNPRAFGVSDRNGFWYNLEDMAFQHEWRGPQLQNTWMRMAARELDVPQQQLRPKNVPADPVPVYQPRVENFAADNAGGSPLGGAVTVPNLLTDNSGNLLASEDNILLVADH